MRYLVLIMLVWSDASMAEDTRHEETTDVEGFHGQVKRTSLKFHFEETDIGVIDLEIIRLWDPVRDKVRWPQYLVWQGEVRSPVFFMQNVNMLTHELQIIDVLHFGKSLWFVTDKGIFPAATGKIPQRLKDEHIGFRLIGNLQLQNGLELKRVIVEQEDKLPDLMWVYAIEASRNRIGAVFAGIMIISVNEVGGIQSKFTECASTIFPSPEHLVVRNGLIRVDVKSFLDTPSVKHSLSYNIKRGKFVSTKESPL